MQQGRMQSEYICLFQELVEWAKNICAFISGSGRILFLITI